MKSFKTKFNNLMRTISILVCFAFTAQTLGWAYPDVPSNVPTLAVQGAFSQKQMTESAEEFQRSLFARTKLLTSVFWVAEYLFEGGHPIGHLETVVKNELKDTVLPGIRLSGVEIKEDGVALIPYKKNKDAEEIFIQIGDKRKVSSEELAGYEWVVSGKYVVKVVSETVPSQAITEDISISKRSDAAKSQYNGDEEDIKISGKIKKITPDRSVIPRTEVFVEVPSRFSIQAIRTALLVLLPGIANAGAGGSVNIETFSNAAIIVTVLLLPLIAVLTAHFMIKNIIPNWLNKVSVEKIDATVSVTETKETAKLNEEKYAADVTSEDVERSSVQEKSATAEAVPAIPSFETVGSRVNNNRTKIVDAGNTLVTFLNEKIVVKKGSVPVFLHRESTTAELRAGLSRVRAEMKDWQTFSEAVPGGTVIPDNVRSAMETIKVFYHTLEPDGIVATVLTLARRAKRVKQKLIIGLETDWIPGFESGKLQHGALNALVREIGSLGKRFKARGLDNVVIIHTTGDTLAAKLRAYANRTSTPFSNIVVLASKEVVESDEFYGFHTTYNKTGAFLAGIDPTELITFYEENQEAIEKQLYIRLIEMLTVTLELAMGKHYTGSPIKNEYFEELRMIIFYPKAQPRDYDRIRKKYRLSRKALIAA